MTYRFYTEEENEAVKVLTPEQVVPLNERGVRGFETETFEVEKNSHAERMGLENSEYDIVVYVDNALSVCRNTSGWNTVLCQEHVKDRVLYRCLFCHVDEQDKYCKAINSSGRRCALAALGDERYPRKYFRSDIGAYCSRHSEDKERDGHKFSLEKLDDYLEGWQLETIKLWKRDFISRLQFVSQIGLYMLTGMKDYLREVPSGPLGSKEYKQIRHVLDPKTEYTYFILCDGYVKIGKSNNPFKRFEALTRENDVTIRPKNIDIANAKLLGYVIGGGYLESRLHTLFWQNRVDGEWFHYDSKIAKAIEVMIGSDDKTIEWLLEDVVKNYEVLMSHDPHGGYDYKEDLYSNDSKRSFAHLLEHNEKARKKEYGF